MSNYSKNIWFDGKIIPFNDAKIHVMSHCVHYGSGVFEGIKCYDTPNGPAVFRLKEHMDRLHKSAEAFSINIPFSIEELCQASIDIVKANDVKDCSLLFDVMSSYDQKDSTSVNFKKNNYSSYSTSFSTQHE